MTTYCDPSLEPSQRDGLSRSHNICLMEKYERKLLVLPVLIWITGLIFPALIRSVLLVVQKLSSAPEKMGLWFEDISKRYIFFISQ